MTLVEDFACLFTIRQSFSVAHTSLVSKSASVPSLFSLCFLQSGLQAALPRSVSNDAESSVQGPVARCAPGKT